MSKQYGLILPHKDGKRAPPVFQASKNIFADDSDSDKETTSKQKPLLRTSDTIKRQTKRVQEKAIEEDPTVYLYDELYDQMDAKKKEEKQAAKVEKKPKYIEKLIETASKRKREQERRVERQVQKEREEEGSKFADKESFVTSSYKKKLEELRQEEEREKREEYLENIGDVTKQEDLGGFYRHFYEQKLQLTKPETHQKDDNDAKSSNDLIESESQSSTACKDKGDSRKRKSLNPSASSNQKVRTYRKRLSSQDQKSTDESDGEIKSDEEINRANLEDLRAGKRPTANLPSNIDADSDFSIDSSSSESENGDIEVKSKEIKIENNEVEDNEVKSKDKKNETEIKLEKEDSEKINEFKVPDPPKDNKIEAKAVAENEKNMEEKIEEPKIDIWKKRTVGAVFEDALKRYYQRKAARGQ